MKYWGPINSSGGINGNDGYVDGNPSIDVEGSIPTFHGFEQTLRELQNFVIKSGMTPDSVLDGIQISQSAQSQKVNYAIDTGAANALVAALDPAPPALQNGLVARVLKINAANTTATPTLNLNGFGPATITDRVGAALTAGDLPALALMQFVFKSPDWRYMGVVAADLGRVHTLYNVQPFQTTARVSMVGNAGNSYTVTAWSGFNYNKISATSNLLVWLAAATMTPNVPAGASIADLIIGSTTTTVNASNSQNNATVVTSAGPTALNAVLSGLGAGAQAVQLQYRRADATGWTTVFDPNNSDAAYYGATSLSSLIIGELEP